MRCDADNTSWKRVAAESPSAAGITPLKHVSFYNALGAQGTSSSRSGRPKRPFHRHPNKEKSATFFSTPVLQGKGTS